MTKEQEDAIIELIAGKRWYQDKAPYVSPKRREIILGNYARVQKNKVKFWWNK